ncbi:MAG TPA: hypothetical protein VGJ26_16370, partial [Pirellulales bacterium]
TILALSFLLAAPHSVSSQVVKLTIDLPVDESLAFRPEDVLISAPGRNPVLRSEFRPPIQQAIVLAKRGGNSTSRQASGALESWPLLLNAFLRPSGAADLLTPITLEPITEIEAWCDEVLGRNDASETAGAISDKSPRLPATATADVFDWLPDWMFAIHCPQDLVDHFDLSSIRAESPSAPPSMTEGAASYRPSWAALEEVEEPAGQRGAQPSIRVSDIFDSSVLFKETLLPTPVQQPQEAARASRRGK